MATSSDSAPFVTVINGSSDPQNPTGYTMLEPGSSLTDGNWIILTGGDPVRIPAISVNYGGPDTGIDASNIAGLSDWPFFSTFSVDPKDPVLISPKNMTVPFDTYPVYTESNGHNNVGATFYGSSDYAGRSLTVKLLDLTSVSDQIDFTDITSIKNSMKTLTLKDITSSTIDHFTVNADSSGDITLIGQHFTELSGMHQGYYALVVMDYSDPNFPCIVAEAPIIVTYNTMDVSVNTQDATPKPGDWVSFSIDQQGALPDTYTYATVMIPEANYSTDINITSDGSLDGTFLTFHGLSLNETFNVVSDGTSAGTTINFDGLARHEALTKAQLQDTNYMEQLAKDELAQSNIAFAVTTTTDTNDVDMEVPTTSTMPSGKYIVLSVAVDRDTGKIAAINQTSIYLYSTWTYNLLKGWNLISIPIVPLNNNLTAFFGTTVMSDIAVVWEYNSSNGTNAWAYYTTMTDRYVQGSLRSVNERQGYWVRCNDNITFTVTGSLPENSNVVLNSGWNLVGNPTFEVRQPWSTYSTGKVIWEYNSSKGNNAWSYYTTMTDKYLQGSLTELKPGYGYWVRI